MKRILIIEDDPHVGSFVKKGLEEELYQVAVCTTGEEGLTLLQHQAFDLVILDIMLPGISGLEVCTRMRQKYKMPILMLTALGTAENVALGLNTGADDYLVKPFKFIELLARIKSLLRRVEEIDSVQHDVFSFGGVMINDDRKSVTVEGKVLMLTSTEYRLLLMFVKNARRVLSRQDILSEVWGEELSTNVVDVYVNYLRKKLDAHDHPKLIHTVTGMGYVLKQE